MISDNNKAAKPKLILLDVYETLLDMSLVEKKVNQLLNNKKGYTIWFDLFMQYCFVDNCIEQFNNFSSIASATMQMAAQTMAADVQEDDIQGVLELLKHLPVHEGVQAGLSGLIDQGFEIAALTNSSERTVTERMVNTGLISYFKKVMSAEHVGKYKPDLKVYNWAVKEMETSPHETLLVSAHGWDIAGAANAGMQTAYLKQSKQMLYPLSPQPGYSCTGLTDLAFQLSQKYDNK